MRRAISPTAAMLTLASILLAATPTLAAYGAIAWDKQSGKRGWSWNEATAQKAAEVAISECGASGCKVIIRTGQVNVPPWRRLTPASSSVRLRARPRTRPGLPRWPIVRRARPATASFG